MLGNGRLDDLNNGQKFQHKNKVKKGHILRANQPMQNPCKLHRIPYEPRNKIYPNFLPNWILGLFSGAVEIHRWIGHDRRNGLQPLSQKFPKIKISRQVIFRLKSRIFQGDRGQEIPLGDKNDFGTGQKN